MTRKSLVAVLMSIFIAGLSQRVGAIDFGEPNWVEANNLISYFDGNDIILYDLNMNIMEIIHVIDPETYLIQDKSMAWSPDGDMFIIMADILNSQTGIQESPFQVWDFTTRTLLYESTAFGINSQGMKVTWAPNSLEFAIAKTFELNVDSNQEIVIYQVSNGIVTPESILSPTTQFVNHMTWGANNHLLAITNEGVKIWDLSASNTPIAELPDACSIDDMPVFRPDGTEFACLPLSSPREIHIWQTSPTQYERKIDLPDRIWGLAWGQYGIVSIHYDDSLRIIDPTNSMVLQTVENLGSLSRWVTWNSAKTEFLIDSDPDGYQIRDGRTGELLASFPAQQVTITPTQEPTPTEQQ